MNIIRIKSLKFLRLISVLAIATAFPHAASAEEPYSDEQMNPPELYAPGGINPLNTHYMTREDFYAYAAERLLSPILETAEPRLPFADSGMIKDENKPYLAFLYEKGFLDGGQEGINIYLRPKSAITRQDAVSFIGRLLDVSSEYDPGFSDSDKIAQYARGYVGWLGEHGLLNDYGDGSFRPLSNITAGELEEIVSGIDLYRKRNRNAVASLAGAGSRGHSDGKANTARFTMPYAIFHGSANELIVLDTYNNMIRKIQSGSVRTVAGSILNVDDAGFSAGYYRDGSSVSALFNRPTGGAVNSKGEIFIADSANNVIRVIKNGKIYTYCGSTEGFADGADRSARFNRPMAVAVDGSGNLYVADTLNNCIRKIDSDGGVTTIAGTPQKEGFADGAADKALFRAPSGIAVSEKGVVYVSDTGNHRIRKIENGTVSTIAGRVESADEEGAPLGGFRDGAADSAMFNLPMGLALSKGILIVADSGNNRIRALDTTEGSVSVIAGNGEPGDRAGGALEAMMHRPMGVYLSNNTLYIADTGNNKIKTMPFNSLSN